jgi:hypothetical protein
MQTDAPVWRDLERIVIAASLGEIELEHALAKLCRVVTTQWGPSCRFAFGRAEKAAPGEQLVVIAKHEETRAGALFIGETPELEPLTLARLKRLVQLLLEALDPYPRLHQLRNRLSGVLLNVEFVEMMIKDGPEFTEERIGREQRVQVLTAIGHARRASSDIVELVRKVAEPDPSPMSEGDLPPPSVRAAR